MLAVLAQSAVDMVAELEGNLFALVPVVILVSALLLSPDASARVKQFVPMVVAVGVAVLSFVVTEWPEGPPEVVIELLSRSVVLSGLAVAFYGQISAALAPFLGDSLTRALGPGITNALRMGREDPDGDDWARRDGPTP